MKLNLRQQAFIAAYLKSKNATRAAMEAGYSKRTAYSQGHDLLKHPEIKGEIERRTGEALDRYEISADNIMRELATMAFANIDDFIAVQDDGNAIVDLSTSTRRQRATISSIDVEERTIDGAPVGVRRTKLKMSLAEKRAALVELAKLRRMYPSERVEHSGPGGGPLQVAAEHKIDVKALDRDQRDQLRQILLAAKRRTPGLVTDVEDESE